jgi:hypothetical protein
MAQSGRFSPVALQHICITQRTAKTGQVSSFDAVAEKVRLRIKKRSFAKRIS